MHQPSLFAVTTLLFVALSAHGCSEPEGGGSQTLETTAKGWVDDGVMLLDVRTRQEFATTHVRGAVNIPVEELASRIAEVEGSRVVVYCRSGRRSATAAEMLEAEGKNVLDVGAMTRWPVSADIVPGEPMRPPG